MTWTGTALVTGASAGLGLEFARQLAARGCNLILCARRGERLRTIAESIRLTSARSVIPIAADLSTEEGIEHLLDGLDSLGVVPQYLVNNAGRGFYGSVLDTPLDVAAQIMRLNVEALTVLTLRIGEKMAARGSGGILNIASTAAYQPVPYLSIYSATKAYVLSFSEAVSAELSGRGVRVFTVCPGATETEFGKVSGFDSNVWAPTTTAEACVRRALSAYESGVITHVDGALNSAGALLSRFLPHALLTRFIATAIRK
jgi:short-subunit dehydrogenase